MESLGVIFVNKDLMDCSILFNFVKNRKNEGTTGKIHPNRRFDPISLC